MEWKGYEIHPDLPAQGIPRELFMRGSHFQQAEESLRRLAADAGLSIEPPPVIANTHLALEASEFAREHHGFAQFHRRLFEAYFQEGIDIGQTDELVRLGREIGLHGDALRQALGERRYQARLEEATQEAHDHGITGTPTFLIGQYIIVGAQPYEVLQRAAIKAGARPRAGG